MYNFNETEIKKYVAPHYGELNRIVKAAHKEFLKIPASDGIDYSGIAYAWIMLKKIEDLLSRSYIITEGYGEIKPFYNIFLLEINGIKISFNKIDAHKRKSKVIPMPYETNLSGDYGKQVSFFDADSEYNCSCITEKSPLTIGYMLKNADVSKTYITHQLGKLVHWYENISEATAKTIDLNYTNNAGEKLEKPRRVKSNIEKDSKVISISDSK